MAKIEQLKAKLFELTYMIDREKRKDIMEKLCMNIKECLDANEVAIYMYNPLKVDDRIYYYASSDNTSFLKAISSHTFSEIYEQHDTVSVLHDNSQIVTNDKENILLKIVNNEYFSSFIVIELDEANKFTEDSYMTVRDILRKFLMHLFKNRHYQFVYKRYQLMFELSTKLHSVHYTNEVLEQVNETTKTVFPSYDYNFLMAHEIEHSTLPVKLIEFSKNTSLSPELIALINNELQFEYDQEKDVTYVYSPMGGNQAVYGVLQLIVPKKIEFVESEMEFIIEYTKMIGRVIERTTLYQSSNRQVNDLQILNSASHEFNVDLQLDEITETVMKHIYNSCNAEQIGVVLFDIEDEEESVEILDESTDFFTTDEGMNFVELIYQRIINEPTAFLSGDYRVEAFDFPYRSLMVIPLKSSETLFGMMIIAHRDAYYFSFDKFKFIQSLVQHASLAYANSILTDRLKEIARTDHLTKLYARSYIDELINKDMLENNQGGLILFDIDDFKKINDTFGHYIGDRVLIQVANLIDSEMEEDQIAARWGGEEFAIYLPNATIEECTEKANIIREKVNKHSKPKVSLSCGVSVWEKGYEDSIERLFIRADKALYEAKTSGKNKVVQNVEVG